MLRQRWTTRKRLLVSLVRAQSWMLIAFVLVLLSNLSALFCYESSPRLAIVLFTTLPGFAAAACVYSARLPSDTHRLAALLRRLIPAQENDAGLYSLVRGHLMGAISSISKLDEADSVTDSVAVRFIEFFLATARSNAEALENSAADENGTYPLTLPENSQWLASKILAEHMKLMDDGDTYSVISDFMSWYPDGLQEFRAATREAIAKGVRVRRVFCRFGTHDLFENPNAARKLLYDHWQEAAGSTRIGSGPPLYELRVAMDTTPLPLPHLGIFTFRGQTICFEPTTSTLSNIAFSRRDRSPEFKQIWERAASISTWNEKTQSINDFNSVDAALDLWWRQFRKP